MPPPRADCPAQQHICLSPSTAQDWARQGRADFKIYTIVIMMAKATAPEISLNQGCLCWPWRSCRDLGQGAEQPENLSPFCPGCICRHSSWLTHLSVQLQENRYQLQDAVRVWEGPVPQYLSPGQQLVLPLCAALAPGSSFIHGPGLGMEPCFGSCCQHPSSHHSCET